MASVAATARRKRGKRWWVISILLLTGAVCGLVWWSTAEEQSSHAGVMIGRSRAAPAWVIKAIDWTGIAALQNLFVIASEGGLWTVECNDEDLKRFERF